MNFASLVKSRLKTLGYVQKDLARAARGGGVVGGWGGMGAVAHGRMVADSAGMSMATLGAVVEAVENRHNESVMDNQDQPLPNPFAELAPRPADDETSAQGHACPALAAPWSRNPGRTAPPDALPAVVGAYRVR